MVNREALWVILGKLIQLFHDDMTGNELPDGCPWEKFNLSNGMKQGYVLAPVLFNLFFTKVMLHVVRDLDNGIYVRYRLDGSLFDLHHLAAKTKTHKKLLTEALFANDCALMAHKEKYIQTNVDIFSVSTKLFGLTISLRKTEVILQPAPMSALLSTVLN